MSLVRVALLVIQATCNHLSCTLPNPTPSTKGRYHMDELYILSVGPLLYKMHKVAIWLYVAFEALYFIAVISPISFVSPFAPTSSMHTTSLFLIGVLAVVLGTYIRLDCFHTLGDLFTIDLAVHPQHKLITSRFYAYVRHPSYTGCLLLVGGLTLSHLTQGSWLSACGPFRIPGVTSLVWALWWAWTLCVVISRADAEDKMMHKLFGAEWEAYATRVPWSFFPGVM